MNAPTPILAEADSWLLRFPVMACGGELRVCGADEAAIRRALRAAHDEVLRIEAKYSRYRADSLLSRINASAGHAQGCSVDAETAQLLDFAARLHAESAGLFDISSGVLRRAWDFRKAQLPDTATLSALQACVGWQQVDWDAAKRRIRLPRLGMELDFGGFGKEYAADRAATVLIEHGLRHGYVNLGGDIRVIGPRADGSAWHFGIQHPREERAVIGELALQAGALATSGDYERYFEHEGQRYCHILDPRSGWPVRYWRSVSVCAPLCIAAGALTTIAMLMEDRALDFLRDQHVDFMAVDNNGQIHTPHTAR